MSFLFITPDEIVLGLSVGLLLGLPLAGLVGCGRVVVGQTTTDTVLGAVVSVSAVGVAGITAASMELIQLTTAQLPRLSIGSGVVFALALYADSYGARLADELPRATAQPTVRTQPLAADAIDAVDAAGQVTIRSVGSVRDHEGYPPLGPSLRTTLEDGRWRLPADLSRSELETRLEDRLRTTHDLAAIDVAIDGRGRATITAAPPINDLAADVPSGWRAVSVQTLVPAGIDSGDEVLVSTATTTIRGRVLRVAVDEAVPHEDRPATAPDIEETVLIAVPTPETSVLLEADAVRLVVTPTQMRHEFDAISLLERGGATIRRTTITASVRDVIVDDAVDVDAIAVRPVDDDARTARQTWTFEPSTDILEIGDDAFLVGTDRTAVDSIDRKQSAPEVSY
ncbi:hypothetical protein [Natronorubrum thiooxidans]|uniref:RCK C-terminal domain-containing protein n=1 Tax=Natronorubrum thiooxidans TaxID=308853 RepID=A0A1N7FL83_9EURY|nr:hypothetical protein [Natronorubrum thiooxidans]SIS01132.1 hypothetical protein SAMN05421752_107104 [Natronorubrum thiooxidans]